MQNRNSRKIYSMFFLVLITGILLTLFSAILVQAAAASGTHTPVTGVTVGVSGATDNSMTSGAVTVTAQGESPFLGFIGGNTKTATITVTNKSGTKATVGFDWVATSVNQLVIDGTTYTGTSGTFKKTMEANASATITITTAKNNTTNTLVMSNFSCATVNESSTVNIVYDSTLGSVTVAGTSVTSGYSTTVTQANGIAISATPISGATFLGWINESDGALEDSGASTTYKPTNNITLRWTKIYVYF